MGLRALWDPRLDPRVTPDRWSAVKRRNRTLLGLVLVLVVGLAGFGRSWYLGTLDKTKGLLPEEVVEAAGLALAQASSYRFLVQLSGDSPDGFFPSAAIRGEYQRKPLLLHLSGEAGSGEMKVPLEYYLDERTLYLKDPRTAAWLQVPDADLEELYAFQPDNLAAPLVTGLRAAQEVSRERLAGGEAISYRLTLDPKVMRVQPGPGERVEYQLWVDTRSLKPVLFVIDVVRNGESEAGSTFRYEISWEFDKMAPLAVPEAVKQAATGP